MHEYKVRINVKLKDVSDLIEWLLQDKAGLNVQYNKKKPRGLWHS